MPSPSTDTARALTSRALAGDTGAIAQVLGLVPSLLREMDALRTMNALRLDGLHITSETVTDYGVQYAPNRPNCVRWDPQYEPYTLAQAQSDAARNNYPVVTRQRTEYWIEDVETPWVPYEG